MGRCIRTVLIMSRMPFTVCLANVITPITTLVYVLLVAKAVTTAINTACVLTVAWSVSTIGLIKTCVLTANTGVSIAILKVFVFTATQIAQITYFKTVNVQLAVKCVRTTLYRAYVTSATRCVLTDMQFWTTVGYVWIVTSFAKTTL